MDNILPEIKYRGLSYTLDKVENGVVYWTCLYSRHTDQCSVDTWKSGSPYEERT
jgi:hypothetical protein